MSELPPEIDEADAMLGALARMDFAAARHVHECLLDTIDPGEVGDLSRAYQRCSRSVRQTLALHSKLKHDRARAAREAEQHAALQASRASRVDPSPDPDPNEYAVSARACDLVDAVDRVISAVASGDTRRHTEIAHRFDRELDDWREEPDFLDYDLDTLVDHACRVLELPHDLAARWRDLPQPAFTPEPAPRDPEHDARDFIYWPPGGDDDEADAQPDPDTPWADSA